MKIKKILGVALSAMIAVSAVGCSNDQLSQGLEEGEKSIVVGATAVPHAEILEEIKPVLKEKGYELNIEVFDDYTLLNTALEEGDLDANFFQHVPFLDETIEQRGYDLTYTTKVHIEPMGLYSDKIKSLDDITDGAVIAIPNDASNASRALKLLESNGIIKLNDSEFPTPADIVDNKKNIKIEELDAAQLPRVLTEVDGAIINTNFALQGDLNPVDDAIVMESSDSPYSNILACRTSDKDSEILNVISEALNSDEARNFIEEKYEGSIVPAF